MRAKILLVIVLLMITGCQSGTNNLAGQGTTTSDTCDPQTEDFFINFSQQGETIEANTLSPSITNYKLNLNRGAYSNSDRMDWMITTNGCMENAEVTFFCKACTVTLRHQEDMKAYVFDIMLLGVNPRATLSWADEMDFDSFSTQWNPGVKSLNKEELQALGMTLEQRENQMWTVGVDGPNLYIKVDDEVVWSGRDINLMRPGQIQIRSNGGDHGLQDYLQISPLPPTDFTAFYSDFSTRVLDPRDWGMKEAVYTGSIQEGSNQLSLNQPANSLQEGDQIIVEIGGEAGQGLQGSVGVGGANPSTSVATEADLYNLDMNSGRAYVESEQVVYRKWADNDNWFAQGSEYYSGYRAPRSLIAKIVDISEDRRQLTLDKQAAASTTNTLIHHDNTVAIEQAIQSIENRLIGDEPFTLILPAGRYAAAGRMQINRDGWSVIGQGQDKTLIYTPKGLANFRFASNSDRLYFSDFHLYGSHGDHGYMPEIQEGIVLSQSTDSVIRDITISNANMQAVGARWATNLWAYNVTSIHEDGLLDYYQWMFQWADSWGGGCVDCVSINGRGTAAFESFDSSNVQFIRPFGVNALVAVNSGQGTLFEDMTIINEEGSVPPGTGSSIQNPIVNINDNLGRINSPTTVTIDGFTHIIEGPLNDDQALATSISINHDTWSKITIKDAEILAPNYLTGSVDGGTPSVRGISAGGSVSAILDVENIHVHGDPGSQWRPHINTRDMQPGGISGCIADNYDKLDFPNDCITNEQAGINYTIPELKQIGQQLQEERGIQEIMSRRIMRTYEPREGPSAQSTQTQNLIPQATITSPLDDANVLSGESITVEVQAYDIDGSITKVELLQDGEVIQTDETAPFNFEFSSEQTGEYSLRARAFDNEQASRSSQTITITVNSESGDQPQTEQPTDPVEEETPQEEPDETQQEQEETTGGSTGGGSSGGGFPSTQQCQSNFECEDWNACSDGVETRLCHDINECDDSFQESRSCTESLNIQVETSQGTRSINAFDIEGVLTGDFGGAQEVTITLTTDRGPQLLIEDTRTREQQQLQQIQPGVYSNAPQTQEEPEEPQEQLPLPGALGEADPKTQFDYLLIFGIIGAVILLAGAGVEGKILYRKKKQDDKLRAYIQTYKQAGKEKLEAIMIKSGWQQKRVEKLLDEEFSK